MHTSRTVSRLLIVAVKKVDLVAVSDDKQH